MPKGLRSIIPFVLCVLAAPTIAQDLYVPAELAPWRDWVLHEKEYRQCPFVFNRAANQPSDFVCAWPGALTLNVDASGGTFSQAWTVYAGQQWLALPGDSNYWPEDVQVDGGGVSIVLHEGSPTLRLGPGRFSISGKFRWEQRPQQLAIPGQAGILVLIVDGTRIARPERNQGGVWLGEREEQKAKQDAVQVQVYRLLADDIPTRLTTWLSIEVSGSVREELFGPALPENWIPLAIESELPARLEADGSIRLQLRPGHWNLRLLARSERVLDQVAMPEAKSNMPADEIWSYQSNDGLRVTAVDGANPVDPLQVNVPGEWQQLPAFRMQPGEALTLSERSRGKASADNRLQLERKLWLDFNADGFVYEDTVVGEMRNAWRLDMLEPYALLNATEAGENLLITRLTTDGPAGIEVRQSNADVRALGRLETRGEFAVAGWHTRFESMSIELNLPPGHRLLAAPGVDNAPGSWVSEWQLLDFFLLLIVTIGTARLFGNAAAGAALLALVLSLHEAGSAAWTWLNLLAAVALVRVAPQGRFMAAARAYRAISAVLLVAILVPFTVGQIRDAVYPQLEQRAGSYGYALDVARDIYPASAPVADDAAMKMESTVTREADAPQAIVATGTRAGKSYSRYADNAIVQAGPGRPSWEWNEYRLAFGGPVDAGRTMRLVIIPDWLLSLLRLVQVLAIAAFAAVFAYEILGRSPAWRIPGGLRIGKTVTSLLLVTGSMLMLPLTNLHAETPPAEILKELERRLLAPPDCTPACAEVVFAEVQITAAELSIELSVHALDDVAVPLPGSMNGWRAERIAINGTTSVPVYRGDDGGLWIRVQQGQTTIRMQGPLPPVVSLEVPFPAPPRAITARGDAWLVAGIRDRRLVSGSLQLTRLQQQNDADTGATWEMSRLPVFVRIERQVELDLDWRVNTTVYRIAPQQGALTLDIPLLEGESIVSGDFRVTDGKVQVSMDAGAYSASWSSNLPRKSPLQLTVTDGVPWTEVWQFTVGSVWHAAFEGLPESEFGGQSYGVRTAWFHPRGGESLTVYAERPEGVAGNTLAFDAVDLQTTLGARTRDSSLSLQYRSTRGAQQQLTLPANAQVVSVLIDGQPDPLRADAGVLNIPILPGEHSVNVKWQTDSSIAFRVHSPAVDLAAASGNITLGLEVPENRWILFAAGPDLGPAVLYWSELAALILLALVLGRIDLTPLGTTQWVLLGLGFSTFSWGAFAIVAIWLLSTGARHRWRLTQVSRHFNLLQIGFALLSIAALSAIVTSLPVGLLGTPDMHITGYRSFGNSLHWFADRSDGLLPQASVLTAPLWLYKALILVWALWLSFALLRWLPWAWKAFVQEGLWRPKQKAGRKEVSAHE